MPAHRSGGSKPIEEFAHEIDLPSMKSELFPRWSAARKKLSDLAWDLHSLSAYAHYVAMHPDATEPPIEQRGLYDEGRLSSKDAETLDRLFHECPVAPYSADDFLDGYSFDPTGSLESYNTYRRMTPAFQAKLGEILANIAPTVERICGHYFRIVSSHIWSLNPGPRRYQWHSDWWPVALKKLFILPRGMDVQKGTTAFRLKGGEELAVSGPPGAWIIFQNSVLEHKGIESSTVPRPTVAISIAPSFRTDLRLLDAGCNSGYPWFPMETHSDGNAFGIPAAFTRRSIYARTLSLTAQLAGIEVADLNGISRATVGKHAEIQNAVPPVPPRWIGLIRRRLGGIRRKLLS
jgi:hypothetical protein